MSYIYLFKFYFSLNLLKCGLKVVYRREIWKKGISKYNKEIEFLLNIYLRATLSELFTGKIISTETYWCQDKDKTRVKLKFYMSRFAN